MPSSHTTPHNTGTPWNLGRTSGAAALLGERTKKGLPHCSKPLLQRGFDFDLAGTCSRVLAVSPAQERRGSRIKIWHERCPQLATAKVGEVLGLSGFRA